MSGDTTLRFTIKIKLAFAFGLMIALLAITAGYGIYSLSNINTAVSELIAGPAKRLEHAQNLGTLQLRIVRSQMNMATVTSSEELARHLEASERNRKLFVDEVSWLKGAASSETTRQGWQEVLD